MNNNINTKEMSSVANQSNSDQIGDVNININKNTSPETDSYKLKINLLEAKINKAHNIITKYNKISNEVAKYNAYLISNNSNDHQQSNYNKEEKEKEEQKSLEQLINTLCSNNKSLLHKNIELKQENKKLSLELIESNEQIQELNDLENEYNNALNDVDQQLNDLNESLMEKDIIITELNEKIESLMFELTMKTTPDYKDYENGNNDDIKSNDDTKNKDLLQDPDLVDGKKSQQAKSRSWPGIPIGSPIVDKLHTHSLKITANLDALIMDPSSPLGTPLASINEQESLKEGSQIPLLESQLTKFIEKETEWEYEKKNFKQEIHALNEELNMMKMKRQMSEDDGYGNVNGLNGGYIQNDDNGVVMSASSGVEDNNENKPLIMVREEDIDLDDDNGNNNNASNDYGCVMFGYRLW